MDGMANLYYFVCSRKWLGVYVKHKQHCMWR